MKKKSKIGLFILAGFLALLAILCWWQRNNLKAVYLYLTLDEEAVTQQMENIRNDHQTILEQEHSVIVRAPDRQQSDDLLDGKVSPEEVKEQLGITPAPTTTEPAKKTPEELLNACVAELYACKVDLMATLGGMKQALLDKWIALPPEARTIARRTEMGMAALEECYALEVVVDEQVEDILDKYRPLLTEAGGDATVLDTLWVQYCEEKAAEKAYYLNKYL